MRILIGHNSYQQPGGEDAVVQTEFSLLKDFGEDVRLFVRSNSELKDYSLIEKLRFMTRMGWQENSYREMIRTLKDFRPDIAHFHNIFFMLSPSVYQACRDEGVAVVQSFHNFRLLCSNALLFRNNRICEECIEHKNRWRGVYHGCYKKSRFATAFVVQMLERHWKNDTWTQSIDAYITATEFGRQKYIAAGIPEQKIFVKPNIDYPAPSRENHDEGYFLFVGRLSHEKGVDVLLRAWDLLEDVPLKIAGDGPLRDDVLKQTQRMKNIECLGFVTQDRFSKLMAGAKALVVPSVCYENFPRIIAEAFAYGIPLVASNVGTLAEIIEDPRTGLLFKTGDCDGLAEKIRWLVAHPRERLVMQENIRGEHQRKYTAEQNYQQLLKVYDQAIKNNKRSSISERVME